ncbi:MAG: DUF374 domain-containing protein [Thermoanaerobaculia bacterium]|nr:DUF374 domain-containing protein [Thermoanaerobaculia bacterium]
MRVVSFLGAIFIRALHSTLRVRHVRYENIANVPQYILTFWHAHLLLMLHSRFRKPISVMSSRSRDGEIIAGVFRYYGVGVARGSSTRGGQAALREMIRRARNGSSIVFTPDGPTGPARVAKEGVIFAAQATGLPIQVIAFAAKKKSCWDRGTEWSCRIHSAAQSTSTVRPSPFRATATSQSGA